MPPTNCSSPTTARRAATLACLLGGTALATDAAAQLPFRPIGSPSAVDQFQPGHANRPRAELVQTGYRQVFAPPPAGDWQPVAAPQLGGGFATSANTPLITAPSTYPAMAAGYGPCGGVGGTLMPTAYTAPAVAGGSLPTSIPGPATMPPPVAPPVVAAPAAATGAPAGSLVSFGQEAYPLQLGQGLWGQPVAYVPGQGVRNWLRYLSP